MGGYNADILKSVECYDPTTNCWTECADMNEERYEAGATVHNGGIFVVGGHDGGSWKEVERYDPQINAWTKVFSLTDVPLETSCISIDNQLWTVGGWRSSDVSVYDEQNDIWIAKKPMPTAGCYYCFSAPKALLQSE